MNITEPLSARARETPDAPAVLTAEGRLSFAELDRAISWTALSFRKAGLGPGDIAGIDLSNKTQHLIASLALARLGVGQFAFQDSDPPRLRGELARRLKIVATVGDKSAKTAAQTPIIDPPASSLRDFIGLKSADLKIEAAGDGALPFLLLRTSGTTTGIPKVALLTHAVADARIKSHGFALPDGPGTRYLALPNLSFNAVKYHVFNCLLTGGCVALHDGKSEPQPLVDFVTEHRINYISGVPVQAAVLLDIAKENAILFPGVGAFRVSSSLVSQVLREDIQKRLTPNLYISYGIAEVGTIAVAPPTLVRKVPGIVGMLTPGTQAEIIGDDGNSLPPGKAGKLRLKSPGMISFYLDAPEDTARAFRDGWFHTGDLAEFTDDGALIHHGRADDVMIFNGINIHPAEIENTLLRHPAVSEAAAFAIQSEPHGDIPVVAVVIKSPVLADELYSHCRSWLGMRSPQGLAIVPKLPRNAAGKILKHELPKMFRDHQRQNS